VIGFTGKINSGKTSAAQYLVSEGYSEYSFADPIKRIAEIFGFEKHQLYGTQEQKLEVNTHWKVSGRRFLQRFGTDVCRDALPMLMPELGLQESESLWIRLWQIEMQRYPERLYVISDVRYPDEAEAIRRLGGLIIRLTCTLPERTGSTIGRDSSVHAHASEQMQSQIQAHHEINTDGSVQELYAHLDTLIGAANV